MCTQLFDVGILLQLNLQTAAKNISAASVERDYLPDFSAVSDVIGQLQLCPSESPGLIYFMQ